MARPKEKWRIDEHKLNLLEELEDDGSGIVYRAELQTPDGTRAVAAKKIPIGDVDRESRAKALSDLQRMNSPTVVKFLGAVVTSDKHLILLAELAKKGSLRKYLSKQKRRRSFSEEQIQRDPDLRFLRDQSEVLPNNLFFRWALQASLAIRYTCMQHQELPHKEITPHNFVITQEDHLKLRMFELPKQFSKTVSTGSPSESVQWRPSEQDTGSETQVTHKSDIFFLGLIILELITGDKPDLQNYDGQRIMKPAVKYNIRPEIPNHLSPRIKTLLERCWEDDPVKRPTIHEVIVVLQTEWLRNGGLYQPIP